MSKSYGGQYLAHVKFVPFKAMDLSQKKVSRNHYNKKTETNFLFYKIFHIFKIYKTPPLYLRNLLQTHKNLGPYGLSTVPSCIHFFVKINWQGSIFFLIVCDRFYYTH